MTAGIFGVPLPMTAPLVELPEPAPELEPVRAPLAPTPLDPVLAPECAVPELDDPECAVPLPPAEPLLEEPLFEEPLLDEPPFEEPLLEEPLFEELLLAELLPPELAVPGSPLSDVVPGPLAQLQARAAVKSA